MFRTFENLDIFENELLLKEWVILKLKDEEKKLTLYTITTYARKYEN